MAPITRPLRDKFDSKRRYFSEGIREFGLTSMIRVGVLHLGRIPSDFSDAIAFNEMLMRDAGVGMTPGSAFADSDHWMHTFASASQGRILFSRAPSKRSARF
jgi:aspartate/methionine/tyrosine aminotransferase